MGISSAQQGPIFCIDVTHDGLQSAFVWDPERITYQQHIVLEDDTDILPQLLELVSGCQDQLELHATHAIGISLSALVDEHTVLHSQGDLRELHHQPLQSLVVEATGLPVVLTNRVNAMLLAEVHAGSGKGAVSILYLHADEQLGSALYRDGSLWTGHHHSAGQIGYLVADWMAEKPITLAQRASGIGLVNDYNMRSRNFRVPSLRDVLEFAEREDQLAARVIRDGGRVLGGVLGSAISMIDPQVVVVGGRLAQSDGLWWPTFERSFRRALLPPQQAMQLVQATSDSDTAALIGTAFLAR